MDFISGRKIGDDVDFAFDDTIVTGVATADLNVANLIAKPLNGMIQDYHEIVVYNPSTVTDINMKVMTEEKNLKSGTRYALLSEHTIPKSATSTGTTVNTHAFRVANMFASGNCYIVFSNDDTLETGEEFTATLRITEVST